MRQNQVSFLPHRLRSSTSTAMLLRLLRLFVFAAAPVILVASPARAAPEKVQYTGDAKPGTIVVQSGERSLYLITGKDQALKYPVGVGRSGQQWFALRGSPANTSGRRGSRLRRYAVSARRISISRLARREIRWAPRRWCWST